MSDGHLQMKYDSDQENCKPPNGSLQYIDLYAKSSNTYEN